MQCIKCKKNIPDEALYCQYCGKKQIAKELMKYERPTLCKIADLIKALGLSEADFEMVRSMIARLIGNR